MFHPDDTIGPYTLVRTIGRGGYGEVWLAEKRSALLTTQVALKMPLVAENDIETVRHEAALWLQASGHPNIVPVLDADVYEGQVVVASEFIAGGSLHDWMLAHEGKSPSLEEAVTLTNGILAGLDYLHRVGLTHRDLKPENVLLQDGIPRLTDFGLARVLKTEAQTGTISGTPRYMAPETFSGSYSVASDLWAVGVMLQELLTGSHPFPAQEMMSLIVAIQGEEPAPLPDTIPERLRTIVTRLLAKSPSHRYTSASTVREALQNSLQAVTVIPVAVDGAPAVPPHNLPVQPASFIGREKQIADLKGLLEHTHLLTLTGSGGCGKTRLSLQVAEEVLEQFPDGVWSVELAPVTDPVLVPSTVAEVLRVRETPGEPITKTLVAALKGKCLLLVLDNCEHVLDAAALLVDAILRGCPQVRLLVSSREALGIAGERAYRVPSLSLPDLKHSQTPESLTAYESVRLFMDRAAAAKPDFAVTDQNTAAVAAVCHRLDGIPLAIELAAARLRSMTVEELERRLADRFRILTGGSRTALPRQRTLRALVDWSFDLLDVNQQSLLTRLSVFMGGWTLEAAEAVCAGGDVQAWEMLDLLTALVDKSLVSVEEQGDATRYSLLETVRQYAADKLASEGDGETYRRQHRDYFLTLAEEAKARLIGPEQSHWLNILEIEHDNLRQSLTYCLEDAEGEPVSGYLGLRLGAAVWRFWLVRGFFSEGRERLAALLDHPLGQERSTARANALNGAATLAVYQGDNTSARTLHEESLALSREIGDSHGIADSLMGLGTVAFEQGDYALARSLHEQSLAEFRKLRDNRGIAASLNGLGRADYVQGNHESARAYYEESLAVRRIMGDKQGIAIELNNLGALGADQGDFASARALHEESLAIKRALKDDEGIAASLRNLGVIAHQQGDYVSARSHYTESLAIRSVIGDKQGIAACLFGLGTLSADQDDNISARSFLKESLAIRRDMGAKQGIAFSLEAIASLAAKEEQWGRAALIRASAEELRKTIGSLLLTPDEGEKRGREIMVVRQAVGEALFAAAWEEGRAMTMEQAIEYALSEEDVTSP